MISGVTDMPNLARLHVSDSNTIFNRSPHTDFQPIYSGIQAVAHILALLPNITS